MGRDVIVACDFSSGQKTLEFLDRFGEKKPFVKIGMELYYAEGPSIVGKIKERGHKIFLDLKLHDIPNTVKKAMSVLSGLDVDMTNLHAAGGSKMMAAAIEGLTRPDGKRPILIAVPWPTTLYIRVSLPSETSQTDIGRLRKSPSSLMFTNCPGRVISEQSPKSVISKTFSVSGTFVIISNIDCFIFSPFLCVLYFHMRPFRR